MNINKIIIISSLSLALITSAATVGMAVSTLGGEESHVGGTSVEEIQKEAEAKIYVEETLNALKEKADEREAYDFYINFYESVSDLSNDIKTQREKLKESAESVLSAMEECNNKINAIEEKNTSNINKKTELQILEKDQCFEILQTNLYQCDIDKIELEKMVKEYENKKQESSKSKQSSSSGSSSSGRANSSSSGGSTSSGSSGSSSSGSTSSGSSGSSSSGGVDPNKLGPGADTYDYYNDYIKSNGSSGSSSSGSTSSGSSGSSSSGSASSGSSGSSSSGSASSGSSGSSSSGSTSSGSSVQTGAGMSRQ